MRNSLGIIALVLLFIGCDKERRDDCFRVHGDDVTETRLLDSFNKLEVHDNLEVTLVQDSTFYVEITGGENFVGQVHTEVENGTLKISENIGCKFVRSYDRTYAVTVHGNKYRSIEHYGSKSLTADYNVAESTIDIDKWEGGGSINLITNADSCFVRIHAGSGDVTVHGQAFFGYVFQRGFGFMHLSNLFLSESYLDKGGTGDCSITCRDSVRIDFNSPGRLYISGNPTTEIVSFKGDGEIINLP